MSPVTILSLSRATGGQQLYADPGERGWPQGVSPVTDT